MQVSRTLPGHLGSLRINRVGPARDRRRVSQWLTEPRSVRPRACSLKSVHPWKIGSKQIAGRSGEITLDSKAGQQYRRPLPATRHAVSRAGSRRGLWRTGAMTHPCRMKSIVGSASGGWLAPFKGRSRSWLARLAPAAPRRFVGRNARSALLCLRLSTHSGSLVRKIHTLTIGTVP